MSRRRSTIEEKGRQVVLRGWKVAELAREAGAKPIFVGSVGGWMIDAGRLPDLLAVLDRRGISVDQTEVVVHASRGRSGSRHRSVSPSSPATQGLKFLDVDQSVPIVVGAALQTLQEPSGEQPIALLFARESQSSRRT